MKKEILWAAVIGFFFGLILAFGAWRINFSLRPTALSTPAPTPTDVLTEFKITLNTPSQNDVVNISEINVSGITKELTWITVSGEDEDYILQSDDKGEFSQLIGLISGVNQIKVTAFDKSGNQSIQKVLVVYSEKAVNLPKAYIGTVTDISDSTIQIKNTDDAIEQISINSGNLDVVNNKNKETKIVKSTDIAIGDYIVAMGNINSKQVLLAQRILITNPISEPIIEAKMGSIADIDVKNITKATKLQNWVAGKPAKIKLSAIKDTDNIIYVMTGSEKTSFVRSVFVL